jgi:hypothetical protein
MEELDDGSMIFGVKDRWAATRMSCRRIQYVGIIPLRGEITLNDALTQGHLLRLKIGGAYHEIDRTRNHYQLHSMQMT